jgi:hypothetical protein
MKFLLISVICLFAGASYSQCKISLEELIKFGSMTKDEIENFNSERGLMLFEANTFICMENMDMLTLEKIAGVSTYSYYTTDPGYYTEFKVQVAKLAKLVKEEKVGSKTNQTYTYTRADQVTYEIRLSGGKSETGEYKGTIIVVLKK